MDGLGERLNTTRPPEDGRYKSPSVIPIVGEDGVERVRIRTVHEVDRQVALELLGWWAYDRALAGGEVLDYIGQGRAKDAMREMLHVDPLGVTRRELMLRQPRDVVLDAALGWAERLLAWMWPQ